MPLLRSSFGQPAASVIAIVTLLASSTLWAQQAPTQAADSVQPQEIVYKPGKDVKPPKPIFMPDPPYSDSAARKKIQGDVLLAVVVTAEGKVRDVQLVRSLEKSLDQQAITTVGTWRFEPSTKDGKPVAVAINVEVNFHIYQKDKN